MAGHDPSEENLWIDGERVPARSGRSAPVIEPATGEVLARVAAGRARGRRRRGGGGAALVRDRGTGAGPPAAERARVLLRLAERIRAAAEELAALEVAQRRQADPGVARRGRDGRRLLRVLRRPDPAFGGQTIPVGAPGTGLTFREPVGVCGIIVPWNFPIAITSWKVAPALALGNSVVVKPARRRR